MCKQLRITRRGGTTTVPVRRIRYAESFGRKIVLPCRDGNLEYYERIGALEEQLGEMFFRVHRSFLVNLSAVDSYSRSEIRMKSGDTVLMSKYKYADFVRTYANYRSHLLPAAL